MPTSPTLLLRRRNNSRTHVLHVHTPLWILLPVPTPSPCSLNTLGFEWQLTDQQAKWHNCYHQLRRYRVLHGTTDIDVERSSQDGCDWRMVAW